MQLIYTFTFGFYAAIYSSEILERLLSAMVCKLGLFLVSCIDIKNKPTILSLEEDILSGCPPQAKGRNTARLQEGQK